MLAMSAIKLLDEDGVIILVVQKSALYAICGFDCQSI